MGLSPKHPLRATGSVLERRADSLVGSLGDLVTPIGVTGSGNAHPGELAVWFLIEAWR